MEWNVRLSHHFNTANRFVRFVIKHFFQDDCPYIASALSFTSLLAVVPLMSVGLAIFSSFPVFRGLADPMQNFIFNNFVPATGQVVQAYLLQFSSQISKLSLLGVAFLIVTALLLMFTIEQAMNKIWKTGSSRHGVAAFLLYWAILSLTPVLLGLSLLASSYIFSIPFFMAHQPPSALLNLAPFLLSLTGFTFLYVLVPNCHVKVRHAFWGGLFAALLFEAAKQGFAYYLTRFDTYELLYGAFATVPIFFIWVYWVWIITLLGAEISYALSVHHQRREGEILNGFSHALLWLYHLWLAQQNGKSLSFNELVDVTDQPFAVDVDDMLCVLVKSDLVKVSSDGNYILSRDLNQMSLYQLMRLLPYGLPGHLELNDISVLTNRWNDVLKRNDAGMRKSLGVSLETLFKSGMPG